MQPNKSAEVREKTTEALLEGAAPDAGAGALGALSAAAADRFRQVGAPMPRDEYWRYLNPAKFNAPVSAAAAAQDLAPGVGESVFAAMEPLVLAFVNGRFAPALSGDLDAADVEVRILAAADAGSENVWAVGALGRLETAAHDPVVRPFAALNGALATDGVAIRAGSRAIRPIEIRHLGDTEGGVHLRHVVELAPGASLTLLESGIGAARYSSVIEVDVGEGATFDHLRLQHDPRIETAAAFLIGRVGAEGSLKSFTLSGAGDGRQIRNENIIWLEGDSGSAHVAGGVVASGKAQIDNTVFLTHGAVGCESRQVYKNVIADEARGIFQGKILVRQVAQKTDGYQISQSVLLDDRSAFNAKPELEIYADDVKCSHGSTTGAIDPTALFYLRARGVPKRVAEAMLIEAFVEDAIEEISDSTLADIAREEARRLISALTD